MCGVIIYGGGSYGVCGVVELCVCVDVEWDVVVVVVWILKEVGYDCLVISVGLIFIVYYVKD
ncbi:alanine racemase, partial [Enterococcus hirae]